MKIAVFGATGQVGTVMRRLLAERNFPVDQIRFFGSHRSAGQELPWGSTTITVEDAAAASFDGIDIALFSAGGSASLTLAPKVADAGALVIDNSSAWRMDPQVPLVVTEVNAQALAHTPKGIIANPNCTTMAAMPVLHPLSKAAGLLRVTGASYQAVSGTGGAAVSELARDFQVGAARSAELTFDGSAVEVPASTVYPTHVAFNVLPIAGDLVDDGSGETNEEQKFRFESRKILGLPDLLVGITCVRVPVFTGHSLALSVQCERPITADEAKDLLASAPGVELRDVPTPIDVAGLDHTLVGRIRADQSDPSGQSLAMFLCGDNLRKGAALNAVQIAEELVQRNLVR